MTLLGVLDLNDNGHVAFPDLLGWLFFGTIGLLGVAVVAGMVLGALIGTGRGLLSTGRFTGRITARAVRRLTG